MNPKKIGQTIAYLRKQVGFTQKGLADRLFISDKAVSKWERGLSVPDIAFLGKLSVLLDADIDTILEGKTVDRDSEWRGFLIGDHKDPTISFATRIYDKPLVYFLLSYFLLAGIREVLIACTEQEEAFLRQELGTGERLGASFSYCRKDSAVGLVEVITENQEFFVNNNVMTVFGDSVLYGGSLTYLFQRAMLNHNRHTIIAVPAINSGGGKVLLFDEERRVVDQNAVKSKYDYNYLPILFSPGALLLHQLSEDTQAHSLVSQLVQKKSMFVDLANRGILQMDICDDDDLLEASVLIKTIQKHTGFQVSCLEEIAWRRGMINNQQLLLAAQQCEGTECGDYLMKLIKNI